MRLPGKAGILIASILLSIQITSCRGLSGSQAPTPTPFASASCAAGQTVSPSVTPTGVVLTEGNNGQSVTVASGTIVAVDLQTKSYGPWSLPQSSNPAALSRLSGSIRCDGTASATFRAMATAQITALRRNIEVTQRFIVTVVVNK